MGGKIAVVSIVADETVETAKYMRRNVEERSA